MRKTQACQGHENLGKSETVSQNRGDREQEVKLGSGYAGTV